MNLMDNTNKFTIIKIRTFTYTPLILRHVTIFVDLPQTVLHQTRILQNTDELSKGL